MKKKVFIIKKTALLIIAAMLISTADFGAVYTATASGSWSSSGTWVGGTPPSFINTSDQIVIPAAYTVTIASGNNLTIDGALASLDIEGTLTAQSSDSLIMILGSLTGAGMVNAGTMVFNTGAIVSATGTLTANTIATSAAGLHLAGNFMATEGIDLTAGSLVLDAGSTLGLSSGGTLNLSGGSLSLNGGSLGLSNSYNVVYSMVSTITGSELSGSGLTNVTIDVTGANTVTLSSDLTVNGTLSLSTGTLSLWGYNLVIAGDVAGSGSGWISSTASSNVSFNNASSTTGALNFTSSTVGNLTVNSGAGNTAKIAGSLIVSSALMLTSGILDFSGATLTANGAITGTGSLHGNSSSNLTVNSTGGLNLANGGQVLHNLTVNSGSGTTTDLYADLAVTGTLTLSTGYLTLNGHTLTISGDLAAGGSGTITSNASSNIIINAGSSLSNSLNFSTGGNTMNDLTINLGNGSATVNTGSDLTINGALSLTNGWLGLNGHNLTLSGNITAGGSGTITSSSASDITINSASAPAGSIAFTAGGNTVNNLTLNIGGSGTFNMGSDLSISGTLGLSNGSLGLNGHTLTISGDIASGGAGSISSTGSSNLSLAPSGSLSGMLTFASGANTVNNMVVNIGGSGSVMLGSAVSVNGTLTLTSGIMKLDGRTLTINGDLAATGTGTIYSDPDANITIGAANSLTGTLRFTPGWNTVNNLTINFGNSSGSASLGSDITVSGTLSLMNGLMTLNGHNLNINGDIAAGGSGMLYTTGASDISVSSANALSGGLSFAPNWNTIKSLTVNLTGRAGDILKIASALIINDTLNLMSGSVNLDSGGLYISASGTILGGNSSSYIMTSGSGYLSLDLTAGSTAWYTYPVGSLLHYSPVALQLSAGSTGGMIDVSARDGVYAQGTSGTELSLTQATAGMTYMIEPDSATSPAGLNINMQLMWVANAETNGFNRDSAYVSHYTGGQWDLSATGSATAQAGGVFSLQRNGIASFSPFAVFGSNATTTGIADIGDGQDIVIYPNPASEYMSIKMGTDEELAMDIFGIDGRRVASYMLTGDNNTISLAGLEVGSYSVRLYNDKENVVKTFVKFQ